MTARRILFVVILGVLAIAASGCRTSPIYNVEDAPVGMVATGEVTMEQIQEAIIRAGSGLGWQFKPVDEGHLVGTLLIRSHMAQVDVTYDTESYDITYKDSRNLKHQGDTIHSNYNGWVQNLNNAIQAQLAAL